MRGLSFSMPVVIAAVVVVSMTTLGALLMWQGWTLAKNALVASAHDRTLAIGEQIDEKFERHLTPGSVTLLHLARGPLATATTLDQRLALLPLLTDILKNLPAVASVYMGYENGDFFLVRPLGTAADPSLFDAPPNAAFLVQSITRNADGTPKEEWLTYDDKLNLIDRKEQAYSGYDPRTRPWYRGVGETGGQYLTQPYVFYTTRQIGPTQSSPAPNGRGVVALEQNLSSLAGILKGLRLTPHSELAIVGGDGIVYGYLDLNRVYRQVGDKVELTRIDKLGVPALTQLAAQDAPDKSSVQFDVDGEHWFGITVPLTSFHGRGLDLVVAIPDADLLATARSGLTRQFWWALALMAVLLPIGWFVGGRLGHSVTDLTLRAKNLKRFDFRPQPPIGTRIREIQQLDDVLDKVSLTIRNFLTTTETMGSEPGLDQMLAKVLEETVAAAGYAGGAVYLIDANGEQLTLAALVDHAGGHAVPATALPALANDAYPPHLPLATILPSHGDAQAADADEARFWLPLRSRQGAPLGLLLLDQPHDATLRNAAFRAFAEKLSGALSSSIETRQLIEAQKKLLDGFVLLIADAIDAKSPYTGGHCRRVPELAISMVERMAADPQGPFKDFQFTDAQRYEFHLGAWLHDCGKVTSPEHIIDKATKLEAIHNRIHEIRTRFEVLWRDAEIAHLLRLADGEAAERSVATRDALQAQLKEEFAFVATCNIGGEFMTDEAIARIREISSRTWLRHFDDRLGLSIEEQRRMDAHPPHALPAEEHLLADRPEHILPWGAHRPPVEQGDPANVFGFDMALPANQSDLGEIHNLSIGRGTLTAEDRFKINDHVVQTYSMLRSLPWPAHLARVPEIASTHHERMDGKGYPRHLTGAALSVEERVMAVADVFEALTASDRPYKPAKTLTQSLRIMAFMCKEGHLDPETFRYFLESPLWDDYAARYLRAEQRDDVDIAALLAILPQPRQEPPRETPREVPRALSA